jgi:hypothetical protein
MAAVQLAHHPAGPLAAYVEKIWYCDGYQGVHRKNLVLPNGRFQLVISLAEGPLSAPGGPTGELGEIASSLVLGIRSHFSVIDTATLKSAMGVLFWPAGGVSSSLMDWLFMGDWIYKRLDHSPEIWRYPGGHGETRAIIWASLFPFLTCAVFALLCIHLHLFSYSGTIGLAWPSG